MRVRHGDMQGFVASVARASGLVTDKADLLAELLTGNDLRGVFSHGNPPDSALRSDDARRRPYVDPDVKVIQEGPTSVVMDGGRRPRLLPDARGHPPGHREG